MILRIYATDRYYERKTGVRNLASEAMSTSKGTVRRWEDKDVLEHLQSTERRFKNVKGCVSISYDASRYGKPSFDANMGTITVAELNSMVTPMVPIVLGLVFSLLAGRLLGCGT